MIGQRLVEMIEVDDPELQAQAVELAYSLDPMMGDMARDIVRCWRTSDEVWALRKSLRARYWKWRRPGDPVHLSKARYRALMGLLRQAADWWDDRAGQIAEALALMEAA